MMKFKQQHHIFIFLQKKRKGESERNEKKQRKEKLA